MAVSSPHPAWDTSPDRTTDQTPTIPGGREADPGRVLFATSFEPGEHVPAWTSTAEIGGDDRPKASGVDGAVPPGLPGDLATEVTTVEASGEYAEAGEIAENLVDGDPETKWLVFDRTGWVRVELTRPAAVSRYALSSADDHPERDPRDWTLSGSEDGETWHELDGRSGERFPERLQRREYAVENPREFRFYRLDVEAGQESGLLQLGEFRLFTDDPVDPPSVMRTVVDRGPSKSPTAKQRVGFTGLRALHYAGRHLTDRRGYSYNKLFEVDIPVTEDTELSYLVFPRMPDGDLSYAATWVAVDLAFDDHTYLSELGAVDQHQVRVNPQSQGKSKTLSVNQWNHKVSRIGRVAAGKRIRRILLAYDNPEGPADFQGWIDDLRIVERPSDETTRPARPSDYVLTTRGTHSSGSFSRGNTFPATAVPHGFNFWTPVTNAGSLSWLYEYHRANDAQNRPNLQAFSVSHQPSPWMGDRQTFQIMPQVTAGTPTADRTARALPFRHENEIARPHHYRVTFDNGLVAEMAPSDHAALLRFRFPAEAAPDEAVLVFDNVSNAGGLRLDAEKGEVTAYSDVASALSVGATRMFVYATFDRPVLAAGRPSGADERADVAGFLRFDAGPDRTVTMRIATSLLGIDQARRNLELEIPSGASFEDVRREAQRLWDEKLGLIEVEGATLDQLTTLYSNLYRLFLYPNSGFENVGTIDRPRYRYASPVSPRRGDDTPTTTGATVVDGKIYVNNGFWDTYRTTWPAYALLTPGMAAELVDGFVQQFRDGGWISRWSSPGYANLMVGTSSDVAFADVCLKGVPGLDVRTIYQAALKNATVASDDPSVGRKGLRTSLFLGYTTTDTREGLSWALDGYINDFGIANLARVLYENSDPDDPERERYREEYEYFLHRSQNYVTMFDPDVGFFQGRKPDGSWRLRREEFDPAIWGHDYTETNAWNMAFHVPHDGQGLAGLYGGRERLAAKLDQFFATPETGAAEVKGSYGQVIHEMTEARDVRMGMYGHSNQPAHHIAYMYTHAGEPWKTQEKVREVLARLYLGSEIGQGYPGDEDNGEMSAWQVFSALGFYPLQVGSPYYAIGSPLFTKATIHLENGRRLVISAPDNSPRNVYVQGLRVNGKRYGKSYLPHQLLAEGGLLEFEMGPEPSRWASGASGLPPSISRGPKVPRPLADVSSSAALSCDQDVDLTALVDDDSATQVRFDGDEFQVSCRFPRPTRVTFYTLTSGTDSDHGDPRSWVLEGSKDGRKWHLLDRRDDEEFSWRRQTRPFKVEKAGGYTSYRLRVLANTGEPSTSLGELELLAVP